jgi:outer membrane lipoprotein-sorting protein
MKKLIFVLVLALNLSVFAQEKITEGVVASKQTMSSDNDQLNAQLAMIGDINTTTYFKGNKTRSETSNPMSGESFYIMDGEANQMMAAANNQMVGKKYMLKSLELTEEDTKDVVVTKGDETKTVLGYECQEYNVTVNKDGVVVNMDVFTTDKISAMSQQTNMVGAEIEGFPMFMTLTMSQMGMNMTITHEVTEINQESVSDDKFDMTPPEGYEKTDNLQGM